MSFKEFLSSVDSRDDLQDICRANDIPNYSNKNRASLEEWIFQSMNSKQFIKDLLSNFSDSAIILLNLLMMNSDVEAAKSTFLTKYSANTYYLNLRKLTGAGIIFLSEEDDKDIISIPKEFKPWIKDYFKENGLSIEKAPEEGEESAESIAYKDFDALVWSAMIPIDSLRFFLEDQGLPTEGTKTALIHRIFYENQISREQFLTTFRLEELRILAEILELTKGGNKTELVDRIIGKLPLRHSVEEYSQVSESESEEDEEVVIEKPSTLLKLFMSDAIPANKIKAVLTANELDSKGSTRQIVKRLLEESQIPINDILDQMFNLNELKEICKRYGLKRGGNKPEVIATILDNFSAKNLPITYSTPTPVKAGKGAAAYSTDTVAPAKKRVSASTTLKPIPSPKGAKTENAPKQKTKAKPAEKAKPLGDTVFELIERNLATSFIEPDDFNDTHSFVVHIRNLLKNNQYEVEKVPETRQEFVKVEGNNLLVFTAVVEAKKDKDGIIADYNGERPSYSEIVAFIYDIKASFDQKNKDMFEKDTNSRFWYRTADDFEKNKGDSDQ